MTSIEHVELCRNISELKSHVKNIFEGYDKKFYGETLSFVDKVGQMVLKPTFVLHLYTAYTKHVACIILTYIGKSIH